MYIGGLRRRLGLHQPKDVVRAQTQSAPLPRAAELA
jgi:hypothetical protein